MGKKDNVYINNLYDFESLRLSTCCFISEIVSNLIKGYVYGKLDFPLLNVFTRILTS